MCLFSIFVLFATMTITSTKEKTYLAIDPGLRNCGAAIVMIDGDTISIPWSRVYDLSGEKTNPDMEKAADFGEEILEVLDEYEPIDCVLIEYQPPMNTIGNPALVRWNSWIEGFFFGTLRREFTVRHSYSSSVKHFFNIQGGNHRVNKHLVKRKVREYIAGIKTDHECDCILMALYDYKRGQ